MQKCNQTDRFCMLQILQVLLEHNSAQGVLFGRERVLLEGKDLFF